VGDSTFADDDEPSDEDERNFPSAACTTWGDDDGGDCAVRRPAKKAPTTARRAPTATPATAPTLTPGELLVTDSLVTVGEAASCGCSVVSPVGSAGGVGAGVGAGAAGAVLVLDGSVLSCLLLAQNHVQTDKSIYMKPSFLFAGSKCAQPRTFYPARSFGLAGPVRTDHAPSA
jgi:hypothetical protein